MNQFEVIDHTGDESSVYAVEFAAEGNRRHRICSVQDDMMGAASLRAHRIAACLAVCDDMQDPYDLRRQRDDLLFSLSNAVGLFAGRCLDPIEIAWLRQARAAGRLATGE